MPPLYLGIIGLAIFLLLLTLRVPIYLGMMFVGILGFLMLMGPKAALGFMLVVPLDVLSSYTLIVIPMFILMGDFCLLTEMPKGAYLAAYKWMGRWPGSLALATVLGCATFAAASGSSTAAITIFGRTSVEEMQKYNYNRRFAAGCVATAGGLAILIPPSSILALYAITAEQAVGKCLVAGYLPGIVLTILLCGLILFTAKTRPDLIPPVQATTTVSWREKWASLKPIGEVILIAIVVMGSIYLGVLTVTEASVSGVFISFVLAVVHKKVTWRTLFNTIKSCSRITCMIFVLVMGAAFFGRFVTATGLPFFLGDLLTSMQVHPIIVVVIITLIYYMLGCFLEVISMMLLTIPIFLPIIVQLGFDPIWFGVLFVFVAEVAAITPPVGIHVYVLSGLLPDIPLEEIFSGVLPFVLTITVGLALLIAFPQLALFLPGLMR
jgi:tripartite ATP-independent transporter DctM subunit